MKEFINNRLEAYYSFRYGDKYKSRAVICFFFGHRDVREILHTEICEEPWNKQHMQEMDKITERFCHYCDSGYLTTKTLNE